MQNKPYGMVCTWQIVISLLFLSNLLNPLRSATVFSRSFGFVLISHSYLYGLFFLICSLTTTKCYFSQWTSFAAKWRHSSGVSDSDAFFFISFTLALFIVSQALFSFPRRKCLSEKQKQNPSKWKSSSIICMNLYKRCKYSSNKWIKTSEKNINLNLNQMDLKNENNHLFSIIKHFLFSSCLILF